MLINYVNMKKNKWYSKREWHQYRYS